MENMQHLPYQLIKELTLKLNGIHKMLKENQKTCQLSINNSFSLIKATSDDFFII